MAFDEIADDGQAEAEAAVRARRGSVGLAERLENMREKIARDSAAGIGHDQANRGRRVLQLHRHLAARRRELDRVRQQVPDHLAQTIVVAEDRAGGGGVGRDEIDPFRGRGHADGGQRIGDELSDRDRLDVETQLAGRHAREIEHVVDELRLRQRAGADALHAAQQLLLRHVVAAEDSGPAEDDRQRRAQLVGEDGQELVLGQIRFLRIVVQAGVLDGHGRAARHVFDDATSRSASTRRD